MSELVKTFEMSVIEADTTLADMRAANIGKQDGITRRALQRSRDIMYRRIGKLKQALNANERIGDMSFQKALVATGSHLMGIGVTSACAPHHVKVHDDVRLTLLTVVDAFENAAKLQVTFLTWLAKVEEQWLQLRIMVNSIGNVRGGDAPARILEHPSGDPMYIINLDDGTTLHQHDEVFQEHGEIYATMDHSIRVLDRYHPVDDDLDTFMADIASGESFMRTMDAMFGECADNDTANGRVDVEDM